MPTVVNESGLYSLILTSRKPQAKVFRKWVTGETRRVYGADQTMSSREIAELTEKSHDHVRRDIQKMAMELSTTFGEKSEPSTGGRPSVVYLLPKRETLILMSGYNMAMRAKIIDRWQRVEDRCCRPSRVAAGPHNATSTTRQGAPPKPTRQRPNRPRLDVE